MARGTINSRYLVGLTMPITSIQGSVESLRPNLMRLPIGSTPGQVRAATSSLTTPTSGASARFAPVNVRPPTSGTWNVSEVGRVHRLEVERWIGGRAVGALSLGGEHRQFPSAGARERLTFTGVAAQSMAPPGAVRHSPRETAHGVPVSVFACGTSRSTNTRRSTARPISTDCSRSRLRVSRPAAPITRPRAPLARPRALDGCA